MWLNEGPSQHPFQTVGMEIAIAALCTPFGTPSRLRPLHVCFNEPICSSGWFKVQSQVQIHALLVGHLARESSPNDLNPSSLFTAFCRSLLKVTPILCKGSCRSRA